MSETVNTATIRIVADASGVEAGLRRVDDSATRTGRNLENLGRQQGVRNIGEGVSNAASNVEAGLRRVDESTTRTGRNLESLGRQPGLRNMGEGADGAASRVDRSTRNMADSIQRTTAAMQAGSRGTADYFRALANQRGINVNALRPYLAQLESVTRESEAAAAAQRRLDESTRFLADLRARSEGIGRSASELAAMRAAQLGVSDAAGPMIQRLREAEQGATGFAAVIGKAKGALAGFAVGAAVLGLAREVIGAQREFDKLNASLETATGSSKRAGEAFKALQAFAANTPFDLKQTTEAFLELRNLGLTPSERALTSFGNTAASKSKELKDVVEAVADAATGEFDRLKDAFGITSQQMGDKVAFTFQGTTTLVKKNAKDIEEYLTRIGEVQFGGAMERQANTLNGAIGQLGDTWDSVMRSIATNGSGQAIASFVLALGGALQDLGNIIDAVGGKASEEGSTIKESVGIHQMLTASFKGIAIAGVIAVGAFKEVGQEIAALAAAATFLVKGDLEGVKAVLNARRLDAESLSTWVSSKIRAITGATDVVNAAQDSETANLKQNTKDRLAQYAIQLTAEEKRKKAKQDIAEIEKNLTGIDPQTASDLAKLKDALDAGAISQKEYAKYTAKINEEALKNSTAYKDQVKQLDLSAVAIKHRADVLAFANAQEREHLDFLRRTGQISEDDYIGKSVESDLKALQDQKDALVKERDSVAGKKVDNLQQVKELNAQIDMIERQMAARRAKESDEQFERDQKRYREAANNYADLLEAAQAETKAQQERVRDGQDEIDMLGMTSQQIAGVTAQRLRDSAAMLRQRAAFQDIVDWTGRLGDETRKQAAEMEKQASQVLNKEALTRQKELWGQVESTAHDTFISIFDSGKSAFDRLRDTLKNGLLELLYQMTVKQWIISIGASVGMTGTSGVAQAAGMTNVADSAGAAGGISGLIGKAQNASSLYKAISGNLFDGAGSAIASLGNYAGSSSLSAFGAGFAGNTAGTTMSASEMFANAGMANEAAMAGYGQMAGSAATIAAGVLAGHYIGSAISGGYGSNATVNTGTAAGAVIGSLAPGIGTAIGAAVGGVVGGIANRAFGMGDKEVQTTGISGTLSSTGTTAESYATWHQKGGWFRKNKDGTDTTAFSSDTVAALANGLDQLKAVSSNFAASLGVDATSLQSYSKQFNIDLGKDGNVADGITQLFNTVGDELATKLVPNVMQFAKTGETASATLERLAGDFGATTQMAQLLGKTAAEAFGTAGIASAAARERLVTLAGSASSLTSMAASYAQNYLTEGQRLAPVKKAVDEAMSSLGLAGVTTREQFKQVIDSLDLTTEAGARQYVSMMQLSDAFAQVHAASATLAKTEAQIADERKSLQDQLDQLTMTSAGLLAKQRDALDDSNKALFDQVQAAQKAKTAQEAAKTSLGNFIDRMKSFSTTATMLNNGLLLGDKSTLTPEQQYAEARRQFEQARQAAYAGDEVSQGNLQSIENAFLEISQRINGSDSQYSSDLAMVMRSNEDMSKWAADSVDVGQASLDALNDSSATLTDISVTLKAIATGAQYLPAALGRQDVTSYAQAFAAIDYSSIGTSNMTALVDEIKALRASNEAMATELKGLRADQQRQTGDLIQAGATSTQQAAETVVDGVRAAVTDAAYAEANSTRKLK